MKIQQVFENNSAVEITLVEWFIMWTWNDFISKKKWKNINEKVKVSVWTQLRIRKI